MCPRRPGRAGRPLALTILTKDLPAESHARQMSIGLVRSVGCLPGMRHCIPWVVHGVDGVLGIRVNPRSVRTSPLAGLPRPYSQSWSVGLSSTSGTLELGAPIPAHPTAAFSLSGIVAADPSLPAGLVPSPAKPATAPSSSLSSLSQPGSSGVLTDTTGLATMCWQVSRRARRLCVPTLLDTGSTDTVLFSGRGGPPTRVLAAGRSLTGWSSAADATPSWSFTGGSDRSENVVLADDHSLALMDTGIAARDHARKPEHHPGGGTVAAQGPGHERSHRRRQIEPCERIVSLEAPASPRPQLPDEWRPDPGAGAVHQPVQGCREWVGDGVGGPEDRRLFLTWPRRS